MGSVATQGCDGDAAAHEPASLGPPAAPAHSTGGKADGAFTVSGLPKWSLIGNALTPGQDRATLAIAGQTAAERVDAWIDGRYAGRAQTAATGGSGLELTLDLAGLPAGVHTLLLAADGSREAFASLEFRRTHPLYVAVTNDWDDSDNPDPTLRRQERLHANHPELRITHFVGPYTFTDPEVSPSRRQLLAQWAIGQRDQFRDEIGLHIHPYCNFVERTTVPCRNQPSFAWTAGDPTGYTVVLSSYDEAQTTALVEKALELFDQNGLGQPTSFRAGGWTAELHTLSALANLGFVADSSAANWRRLEEWKDDREAILYPWNQEHWIAIDETSQPYYPSATDILEATPPALSLVEVPDNGALVDYVSGEELIEMFGANWPERAPLDHPVAYVIGYHPPNFSESFLQRMDTALTHIDGFLASAGAGPVVYATLSELPLVWAPAAPSPPAPESSTP